MDIHLKNCMKRTYSKLYVLGKIRPFLDKTSAVKLFKSMVLPYLEYGNSFLLGSDIIGKKKLQRTQNKGLKVALGREVRYSTNALHKEAGLASWEVRARIARTRLMFKYKYNEEFVDFNLTSSLTRLQSGPFFKIETPRTDKYRNCVSYLGRLEWNSLPSYIRCNDVYLRFKNDVKQLYNHRYFHSIGDI